MNNTTKLTVTELMTIASIPCKRCNGTGSIHHDAFSYETRSYPARDEKCCYCHGAGHYSKPDLTAIVEACMGRKGLRSKRPEGDREYYIWRLARFHGGRDVTMPMMAGLGVSADPYEPVLDAAASVLARKLFGTDMAAANRWAPLLGFGKGDIQGLPASAYQSGPVTDGLDETTNIMLEQDSAAADSDYRNE